jgi:hypothetical protein
MFFFVSCCCFTPVLFLCVCVFILSCSFLFGDRFRSADMETIEALGQALRKFEGGLILISHHQRLIDLACNQLWVLSPGGHVKRFEGDFADYKSEVLASLPEIDEDDIL